MIKSQSILQKYGKSALPDIGHLFPDTDPAYRGADSMELLKTVVARLRGERLRPYAVDATLIAQRPRLAPYLPQMRENLADACGVDPARVGLKATTTEGMNDEGRGLCISAQAVASLVCPGARGGRWEGAGAEATLEPSGRGAANCDRSLTFAPLSAIVISLSWRPGRHIPPGQELYLVL